MDIIDIIGFFIVVVSVGFLFLRHIWELLYRKRNPEAYAKEQEEKRKRFQKFIKEMQIDLPQEDEEEEEEEEPVFKHSVVQPVRQRPQPEVHRPQHMRKTQPVARAKQELPSQAAQIVKKLPNLRDMVILHEIIGPPKSKGM